MTLFLSHRGESDDAPENTLNAFSLAMERDSDGIELDIRLSADGEVVCVHDETLERVAGAKLAVAEASLAELRKFYPVPRLSEALAVLRIKGSSAACPAAENGAGAVGRRPPLSGTELV